ncbi:MAG: hypothetical protein Q8P24_18970 [Desulfobacterales bacterium]|nr:hypothetical protein [Desulfobacterales bacterium]
MPSVSLSRLFLIGHMRKKSDKFHTFPFPVPEMSGSVPKEPVNRYSGRILRPAMGGLQELERSIKNFSMKRKIIEPRQGAYSPQPAAGF